MRIVAALLVLAPNAMPMAKAVQPMILLFMLGSFG